MLKGADAHQGTVQKWVAALAKEGVEFTPETDETGAGGRRAGRSRSGSGGDAMGYQIRIRTSQVCKGFGPSGAITSNGLLGSLVFVEANGKERHVWGLGEYQDRSDLKAALNNLRRCYERHYKRTGQRFWGHPPSSWYGNAKAKR